MMQMPRRARSDAGLAAPRAGRRPQEAFTAVELAVAMSILAVVLGSVFGAVLGFERLFTSQEREHAIDEAGWRACEVISRELRSIDPSTLLPLSIASSSYVTYQKVTGYQSGAPTLGPVTTLRFTLAPGENSNGVDDNGDGRADEGFLTLAEGANPAVRVQGNLLRLSLDSIQNGLSYLVEVGISDRAGSVRKKTFQQKVTFRTPP